MLSIRALPVRFMSSSWTRGRPAATAAIMGSAKIDARLVFFSGDLVDVSSPAPSTGGLLN